MGIANGGYLLKPQVLLKIGDATVAQRQVRREIPVAKQNIQIVREGMRQVLTDGTTCECTFASVPVKVAGKSGTAQTTSNDERRPHAWFTAFAPYEKPQIMITAMLEEGSGGSLYAAPAIAGALNTFFTSFSNLRSHSLVLAIGGLLEYDIASLSRQLNLTTEPVFRVEVH